MKIFGFFLCLNLLVHIMVVEKPPMGNHVWRQCNTLALARNFYTESFNILTPRIDRRDGTNGITGTYFPLYEWVLGGVYFFCGEQYWITRSYSLIISTVAIWAFYLLLIRLNINNRFALLGGLLLLFVPEFYYQSANALPDIMAMAFAFLGALMWIDFFKQESNKFVLWAFVFSLLAALIKVQFIIISASTFLMLNKKNGIKATLIWVLVLLITFSWYKYSINLTEINNLKEFGLWIKPISFENKVQIFLNNIWSDMPEMLLGWPLFISCLLVVVFQFMAKHPIPKIPLFFYLWFIGFICFYILAIERMEHHNYYFLSIIPLSIAYLIFVLDKIDFKHKIKYSCILLLLSATWAIVRIVPTQWMSGKEKIPNEFLNTNILNEIKTWVTQKEQIVMLPDESGCVNFYFTNTKGYCFSNAKQLFEVYNDTMKLEQIRNRNIRFMIINNTDNVTNYAPLKAALKQKLKQAGNFELWLF